MCNNSTDKKVTVKRRMDGVYDIYVDDKHAGHRGSIAAAVEFIGYLLGEE